MSVNITIEPRAGGVDVSRHIRLTGLAPGERVELRASSHDNEGTAWNSAATFIADSDGVIDLARDAPAEGSYAQVDPGGLIWSQAQVRQPHALPAGKRDPLHPIRVELVVAHGSQTLVQDAFEQSFLAPGVTRTPLDQHGFVGTLFTPAGTGPHPVVVVLNGSGGGINEQRAALLASHGFAALALGYFGAPGLPNHISGTPLEYFETALQWLHAHVRPADGFIAVMGQSRGGELSLLLASEFPRHIAAVVAYVPSSVVHGVLAAGHPGESRYAPAWTRRGSPLLTVWEGNEVAQGWEAIEGQAEPRRQAAAFVQAQSNPTAVARARIPVEQIQGPVLLLSGGDDGYWPSTAYAAHIAQQLRDAHHPHEILHLDFPQAGHFIQHPIVPTTLIAKAHPVSGIVMTGGGTPEANARANRDSWPQCLDFLRRSVAARSRARQSA